MLPFGAVPSMNMQSGSTATPAPTDGQQATFEMALLTPADTGIKLGAPPSDLLPYPFDETKSMGDRIIDAFARMKEAVDPPPPPVDVPEPPETEGDPAVDPGTGSSGGSEASPVVSSVVVEGGSTIEIERPDGRVVTVTVSGVDGAVVETLEDGTTVVRSNGGAISISTSFDPSVAFSVANGDSILASLAQMRGEVS
jgi:hypothetical protein